MWCRAVPGASDSRDQLSPRDARTRPNREPRVVRIARFQTQTVVDDHHVPVLGIDTGIGDGPRCGRCHRRPRGCSHVDPGMVRVLGAARAGKVARDGPTRRPGCRDRAQEVFLTQPQLVGAVRHACHGFGRGVQGIERLAARAEKREDLVAQLFASAQLHLESANFFELELHAFDPSAQLRVLARSDQQSTLRKDQGDRRDQEQSGDDQADHEKNRAHLKAERARTTLGNENDVQSLGPRDSEHRRFEIRFLGLSPHRARRSRHEPNPERVQPS